MPSVTEQPLPPFPEDLPIADIYSVDYEKLKAGDQEEARKVYEACCGYGFFYLANTHIDYKIMFDIAEATFALPEDTKMKYEMGNTGNYYGYKMGGSNYVDEKGTPDKMEFYNISKDDVMKIGDYKDNPMEHPDTVNERRAELEHFMESSHDVTLVILRALAEQLGLDPAVLLDIHKLRDPSVDQARVTFAPPVSEDTITFGEHTDFGSVTILFNQLGGLQIINPDSYEWKYVKPYPGTAIINLGDALVKLLPKLRSAVHRIVGPPGEQAQSRRHSIVYFSRPNSHVKMRSLLDNEQSEDDGMTVDEWIANRVRLRRTANYKGVETFNASRGTEHLKDRGKATLDRPAKVVDPV